MSWNLLHAFVILSGLCTIMVLAVHMTAGSLLHAFVILSCLCFVLGGLPPFVCLGIGIALNVVIMVLRKVAESIELQAAPDAVQKPAQEMA